MTEPIQTVAPPAGRSIAQLTDTVRRACPYRSQSLMVKARRVSYIDEGSSAGVLARQRHHLGRRAPQSRRDLTADPARAAATKRLMPSTTAHRLGQIGWWVPSGTTVVAHCAGVAESCATGARWVSVPNGVGSVTSQGVMSPSPVAVDGSTQGPSSAIHVAVWQSDARTWIRAALDAASSQRSNRPQRGQVAGGVVGSSRRHEAGPSARVEGRALGHRDPASRSGSAAPSPGALATDRCRRSS